MIKRSIVPLSVHLASVFQPQSCYFSFLQFVINKKRKEILEAEIDKIGVPFKFYEVQCDDGPSQTQRTRLDGNYYY